MSGLSVAAVGPATRAHAPGTLGQNRGAGSRASPVPLSVALQKRGNPAPLAQSVERLHGKEKVYGSIP